MDSKIIDIFEKSLNEDLNSVIMSNSTEKEHITKVKIRPILLKEKLVFQASEFKGEKVYHMNYTKEEFIEHLPEWLPGLLRQVEIKHNDFQSTILISKKGKVTITTKRAAGETRVLKDNRDGAAIGIESEVGVRLDNLSHNKKKHYILEEGMVLPFLVDLGVMTQEGKIVKSKSDKFRQINRFLEFIEDILPHLSKDKELTILDFGCGKSYLTFAMYYYLKVQKGYQINVVGLDLKTDVIQKCNGLSKKYGYDKLQFLQGDIASYQGTDHVDMVVTLHACDTATDYALYKAVTWGAEVILSVPCCQHELNKQMDNELLEPIFKYGLVKERMAALITDGFRAELLETVGYRCQLLEFIDMEHTPKNILIRAVKKKNFNKNIAKNDVKLTECMKFFGVNPSLKNLLEKVN